MYDMKQEELVAAVEAEEKVWLSTDDIHPYKSRVPQTKGNTVFVTVLVVKKLNFL